MTNEPLASHDDLIPRALADDVAFTFRLLQQLESRLKNASTDHHRELSSRLALARLEGQANAAAEALQNFLVDASVYGNLAWSTVDVTRDAADRLKQRDDVDRYVAALEAQDAEPEPEQLGDVDRERLLDARVQRRLATDSAYLNAETPEQQSIREAVIEAEEAARIDAGRAARTQA